MKKKLFDIGVYKEKKLYLCSVEFFKKYLNYENSKTKFKCDT